MKRVDAITVEKEMQLRDFSILDESLLQQRYGRHDNNDMCILYYFSYCEMVISISIFMPINLSYTS